MLERLRYHLAWELAYRRLAAPKSRAEMAIDEEVVLRALEASPIPVERRSFDVAAYRRWLERADYAAHAPGYYTHNLPEKSLEHYATATLLGLERGAGDGSDREAAAGGQSVEERNHSSMRPLRLIDIAAQSPVAADLFARMYGVEAYVQDLDFADGVRGREIGGDAAAMPVGDDFADAMTLHCSFEHFEGDADSRFIGEVARVLRPGGRCVIAPLYLFQYHATLTNPILSAPLARTARRIRVDEERHRARDLEPARVRFDVGAIVHASKSWRNRHGRFYSVEQLVERIWQRRGGLEMRVVAFDNYHEIDRSCYLRFALLLERPLR
jgi:SAM-dependent methyltransferase